MLIFSYSAEPLYLEATILYKTQGAPALGEHVGKKKIPFSKWCNKAYFPHQLSYIALDVTHSPHPVGKDAAPALLKNKE